jgi:hypothetical protein
MHFPEAGLIGHTETDGIDQQHPGLFTGINPFAQDAELQQGCSSKSETAGCKDCKTSFILAWLQGEIT